MERIEQIKQKHSNINITDHGPSLTLRQEGFVEVDVVVVEKQSIPALIEALKKYTEPCQP